MCQRTYPKKTSSTAKIMIISLAGSETVDLHNLYFRVVFKQQQYCIQLPKVHKVPLSTQLLQVSLF